MNYSEDLKAYLDGELGVERAKEIEAKLASSPSLRKELDDLNQLSQSIKHYAVQPSAVGLEETLKALEKRTRPSPKIVSRWFWGSGLVATAALVVAIVLRQPTSIAAESADATANATVAMNAEQGGDAAVAASDLKESTKSFSKSAAPSPSRGMAASPSVAAPHVPPAEVQAIRSKWHQQPLQSAKSPAKPSGVSHTAKGTREVAQSSTIQTVVILCDSIEQGQEGVKKALADYAPQSGGKMGPAANRKRASETYVDVDLPADKAEQVIADVKSQMAPVAVPSAAVAPVQDAMRAAGGAQGRTGAPVFKRAASKVSETAANAKTSEKVDVPPVKLSTAKPSSMGFYGVHSERNLVQPQSGERTQIGTGHKKLHGNSMSALAKGKATGDSSGALSLRPMRKVRFVLQLSPPKKPVP